MHAVNPCVTSLTGAVPTPEPERIARGATTFGALMTSRAPGSSSPGGNRGAPESATSGGPLRNRASAAVPTELVDVITQLRRDERTLDRSMRRALAGHDFDMPQLVALQSLAFKYSQRVELLGKLVDRLTGAVKQTLQMQV
jgi:hypothetical protein